MPCKSAPGAVEPFADDAEYLETESRWVRARCRRLAAQIEAEREQEEAGAILAVAAGADREPEETVRKIARLAAAEDNIRQQIEARLKATREAGIVLGLDAICRDLDLGAIDRQVLLLATLPALGLELSEVLGTVGTFGFAIMSVTPELVAVFAGLDLAGRLDLRRRLGPAAKLVKGGLIVVEVGGDEHPQDFPSACIYLTTAAFQRIVGLDVENPGSVCFACGHRLGDGGRTLQ